MTTRTLRIQIPEEDAEFVESYAKKHGKSVDEMLDQFIKELQQQESRHLHPEVQKITGILPEDVDVREEYYRHIRGKHQ